MVNFNGSLTDASAVPALNRGFLFGDAIFETVRISNGKVCFLEDHYFRLMASMRIVRMKIPSNFTLEYFDEQLTLPARAIALPNCRVRLTVFRNGDGYYAPTARDVSFIVTVSELNSAAYTWLNSAYEAELYKDFFISANLLSTLKTNNRMINIAASVFAEENGYQTCLLLNDSKNVVEALSGNVFMLTDGKLVTPGIDEGPINGIMRKQVIRLAKEMDLVISERPVSPFELQRADELFITNVIQGIQPVTRYRKKDYTTDFATALTAKVNSLIS